MIDIDTLLEKTDLVKIAEREGVTLKMYGDDYRGKCPFHRGDNPTAFVIYRGRDGRQRWHSYTEDVGGDALDFIQRATGAGFIDAAHILAQHAGIELPGLSADEARYYHTQREERRRAQDILTLAADHYRDALWGAAGQPARDYLTQRGFGPHLKKLQAAGVLGFSTGALREHLHLRQVDPEQAQKLGLLTAHTNGAQQLLDAIPANYLVYIHQLQRQVVYLAGRSITSNEPERKSRNLSAPKQPFWLKQPRGNAPLLIVEGQACALTAWLWGYHALALCGKSLDKRDLDAINCYEHGVYLCLDTDCTYPDIAKAADQLGPLTMLVKLPWHDLNEGLQTDPHAAEKLSSTLSSAPSWIESSILYAAHVPPFRLATELEHLAKLIATLPQGARGKYIGEICAKRKLAARADFIKLVQDISEAESETNGFEIHEGKLAYYGDPLGNWHAMISHELTLDDGLNLPDVVYTVTGALESGAPLPTLELPAEEFATLRWVNRAWGARAITYVAPGKTYLLQRAIQEVSQFELKRERVHTYTGWSTIEGERHYLTTTGAIHAAGLNPDIRVDLGINNLSRYALPTPPADPRAALTASLDFLNLGPLHVTLPLWLAMYAAPLGPLQTLDAVLWVYGTTQSGKSTVTHLALSHFGNFIAGHKYHAPVDWISTVTAIESALFAIKDAAIIIDDYAPQNGSPADARSLARAAQRVIRAVGNRAARGRARADLSEQRNRPPRSLVIATAENPILGQSTVGRTIYVPIEPGDILRADTAALDHAQTLGATGIYAQAMSSYVSWLAESWPRLTETFPADLRTESQVARSLLPTGQGRLSDYYALLLSAARLAFAHAHARGVLDATQTQVWVERSKQTLLQLLSEQGRRVAAESPATRFWTGLQDLVAQGDIVFKDRNDYTPLPDHKTLGGWYDQEHIYLLTNTVLADVKRYWHELGESLDILSDAFRRILSQQGYIARRADEQMERITYINREVGRVRTLWLDRAAVAARAGFGVGDDAYQE